MLYNTYLDHLKEEVVSKGDFEDVVAKSEHDQHFAACELGLLIAPLSELLAADPPVSTHFSHGGVSPMQRDAWCAADAAECS